MLMRSMLPAALLAGTATVASAQEPGTRSPRPSAAAAASGNPLASDEEQSVYAIGVSMWHSLVSLDLSPAEVEILKRALTDAAEGRPAISLQEAVPKVAALRRARAQRATEKERLRSAAYLEKAEKEPGAVKTQSGLLFFEVQPGTGDAPQAGDSVKVHYRGTLADGTEFDSSHKRGQPAQFQLNRVIRCWTEGLQKMKVGGKARLLCPSSIAYGDRGFKSMAPGQVSIPGGAALTFEVELVEIAKPPTSPAPPKPSPGSAPPHS